jgi:uncharacterized protein (DUF2147 family)
MGSVFIFYEIGYVDKEILDAKEQKFADNIKERVRKSVESGEFAKIVEQDNRLEKSQKMAKKAKEDLKKSGDW